MLLSLYFDGIFLTYNDVEFLIETKPWLSIVFQMKDLGGAEFILGVKITHNQKARLLGLFQKITLDWKNLIKSLD